MILEDFIQLLDRPRRQGRGYISRCPAHDDRNPSLSIREGEKGILIRCWSGCSLDDICRAVNIEKKHLFFNSQISTEIRRESVRRKEVIRKLERVNGLESDVFRAADEIIGAAHGIDISSWTPEMIDRALNMLAPAYRLLFEEEMREYGKRDTRNT